MQESNKGLHLSPYWPFLGLHFGIHLILGLVANVAGIVIICTQNEVLSGLALIGAGSFAIINGWQGFVELRNSEVHERYKTSKESNQ